MRTHWRLFTLLACAFSGGAVAQDSTAVAAPRVTIPRGTEIQIRLQQGVSSYSSKRGAPVQAQVIAPVEVDGKIALPRRTLLFGVIRDVRRVGLGFSRETALLDFQFDRMRLPGQSLQDIAGSISHLDNARERIDERGRIRGIRATDTLATVISGFAISVASFDPMSLAFALSSSLGTFRIPDSSIVLPAGTELHFRLDADVSVLTSFPDQYPPLFPVGQEESTIGELVRGLPYRTETKDAKKPSDLTSLLFIGAKDSIERAFLASGWVRSDRLDAGSRYGTMRSIIENQGYRAAPMSVLLLADREPVFTYAKTLNTFFSRHHLRIYSADTNFRGKQVWTSTGTYDTAIGFSLAAKTFVHVINENIDDERTKIVNDLLLTGCVEGVSYIARPWIPEGVRNATGDTLRTDRRMAILELNECQRPRRADTDVADADQDRLRQSAALRPVRAAVLTLRNDIVRGNLIYQGYSGVHMASNFLKKKTTADAAGPRRFDYAGQEFLVVKGSAPHRLNGVPQDAGHKLRTPDDDRPRSLHNRLMFSLSGGLSGYGNGRFATQPFRFSLVGLPNSQATQLNFDNELFRGWTISPKFTLNSYRYISHEFAYSRTSTIFRLSLQDLILPEGFDDRTRAAIRRYSYNTLFHLLPNGKRFRPYVAVGPAFQLIHLLENKPQSNRLLRLAERDLALFISAYNFGRKPPLEGGGIFQVGVNYGAGARFHLTPRVFLRADYRETLSKQPDFWKTTAEHLVLQATVPGTLLVEAGKLQTFGPLRHQTVTIGIGIAF